MSGVPRRVPLDVRSSLAAAPSCAPFAAASSRRRPRPTRRSTSSPTATGPRRPLGLGARHPARRHPGQDVRPDHAAVPEHHRATCSSPSTDGTRLLQVRRAAGPRTTRRFDRRRDRERAPRRAPAPVSATIKRDPYGVPHIYSATDAGAMFGAGYAVATDQSLLLNQARTNGVAGLIDLPGVPAINLVLGLYNYKPQREGRRRRRPRCRPRASRPRAPRASSCSTTSTPTWPASTPAWPCPSRRRRRSRGPTSTP